MVLCHKCLVFPSVSFIDERQRAKRNEKRDKGGILGVWRAGSLPGERLGGSTTAKDDEPRDLDSARRTSLQTSEGEAAWPEALAKGEPTALRQVVGLF